MTLPFFFPPSRRGKHSLCPFSSPFLFSICLQRLKNEKVFPPPSPSFPPCEQSVSFFLLARDLFPLWARISSPSRHLSLSSLLFFLPPSCSPGRFSARSRNRRKGPLTSASLPSLFPFFSSPDDKRHPSWFFSLQSTSASLSVAAGKRDDNP